MFGLWEKYELSSDTKISRSLEKVEIMGLDFFKDSYVGLKFFSFYVLFF